MVGAGVGSRSVGCARSGHFGRVREAVLHGGARASLPTTARLVALAEDSEDSAENPLLVVAQRRGDLRVREVQLVRWEL